MEEKEIQDLRKRLFSDVEEEKQGQVVQGSLLGLLKGGEDEEDPDPDSGPETGRGDERGAEASSRAQLAPGARLSEEEREALNLREIKMLISEYRFKMAEAERQLKDLRYRLMGLETEYRALMGEPVAPLPPPPASEPAPAPLPEQTARASEPPQDAKRARPKLWDDASTIHLEEAAWRVLTEQGKSMPPWRVVAAVRRKGFKRPFTEEGLVKECRGSSRLGISAGGNVYIR